MDILNHYKAIGRIKKLYFSTCCICTGWITGRAIVNEPLKLHLKCAGIKRKGLFSRIFNFITLDCVLCCKKVRFYQSYYYTISSKIGDIELYKCHTEHFDNVEKYKEFIKRYKEDPVR